MQIASIVSGSSGNCIYVGNDECSFLVDTGVSKKKIEDGLAKLNLSAKDIDGIFITHEHSDHISGLGVFTRKYPVPVYGTKETLNYIQQCGKLGKLDSDLFVPIEADNSIKIKSMKIHPFHISHDALNPVAYRFETEESGIKKTFALATDLGMYTDYTIQNLSGLDVVLLESNHDVNMLQVGAYPYQLKQRILGKRGHLSNEMSGRLLNSILHDNIKKVFLGHLSRENNFEELAYETVRSEITTSDNQYKADDFDIEIASREKTSELVVF